MSYEIFITKANYSWETLDHPIKEEDWVTVANSIGELKLSRSDYYSRKNDDGNTEKFHPWLITSLPNKPPLWFIDGAINTDNPDKETIKIMVMLSKLLDAKVIGEEGEEYDENGEVKNP